MDDNSRNPFDFTEINKIQEEIDKDLKRHMESGLSEINEEIKAVPSGDDLDLKSLSSNDINDAGVPADENAGTVGTRTVSALEPEDSQALIYQPDVSENTNAAGNNSNFNNSFLNATVKNQSRKGKFKKAVAMALVISVAGGFSIGMGISVGTPLASKIARNSQDDDSQSEPEFSFSDNQTEVSEGEKSTLPIQNVETFNYADLIDKVEPSVVSITKISNVSSTGIGFFNMPSQSYEVPSSGSGIIFDETDEKVYIVTNYHVVQDANSIGVSVSKSTEVLAAVVGTNPESDLAVISVQKSDLAEVGVNKVTIAEFADSDQMRVGDFVIAIGNALGEGNTATFGMVSAINKEINVEDRVLTVIQTDAAINPGNSGGPLVNLKGQVIGINTVKLAEESIEGMGYCITSNMAKPIIEDLRNQITKPFLGVAGYDVDERIAQIYDLPQMGIIVETVIEGSSAELGGIKRGDIITSFNGKTVFDFSQLTEELQSCSVGDTVEIKLMRDGNEPMTLNIELLERPASY